MRGKVADVTELLPTRVARRTPAEAGGIATPALAPSSVVLTNRWLRWPQVRPWLLSSILLTLITLASAAGSQFRIRFPDLSMARDIAPEEIEEAFGPPPDDPFAGMPEGGGIDRTAITMVAIMIALLLATALIYILVRYLRQRAGLLKDVPVEALAEAPASGEAIQFTKEDVEDMVTLAQRRMAQAGTPSDAVVAGWLAFEEAAATRGWVREPHETTTEFTARLLAASPAPPAPIAVLRGLYQKVRFGGHTPLPDDVAAARDSLTEIAQHLEAVNKEPEPQAPTASPNRTAYLPTAAPLATTKQTGVTRNKWGED